MCIAQQAKEKGKDLKNILIAAALLCLVAGCASPPADVTTYTDDTGMRTDILANNELKAPGTPREVVWLNAWRVFKTRDKATYYLEVKYTATEEVGYLDIPFGQTLTLVLDGQPLTLAGSGSVNMRKMNRREFVEEMALYEVTRAQLQKMASAKRIQVRIKGNNGLIEREFAPVNYERFRLFVITYAA